MLHLSVFNYDNVRNLVEIPDIDSLDEIKNVFIKVLSGDEVLNVETINGQKYKFDPCAATRLCDFYDGDYILSDIEKIKRWDELGKTLSNKKNIIISYARLDEMEMI